MRFPYEQEAKRGEPMPEGLGWAEQAGYQALANLTARYRAGAISAEQARTESAEIDRAVMNGYTHERYIKHVAELYRDIEWAAMQYKDNKTIENADRMLDVIYGFLRYSEEERAAHARTDG